MSPGPHTLEYLWTVALKGPLVRRCWLCRHREPGAAERGSFARERVGTSRSRIPLGTGEPDGRRFRCWLCRHRSRRHRPPPGWFRRWLCRRRNECWRAASSSGRGFGKTRFGAIRCGLCPHRAGGPASLLSSPASSRCTRLHEPVSGPGRYARPLHAQSFQLYSAGPRPRAVRLAPCGRTPRGVSRFPREMCENQRSGSHI